MKSFIFGFVLVLVLWFHGATIAKWGWNQWGTGESLTLPNISLKWEWK